MTLGGYQSGGTNGQLDRDVADGQIAYAGQNIVRVKDRLTKHSSGNVWRQVVVEVRYRQNVFGYAASRILANGSRLSTGNYGILDQRAALQWVQRNIQACGGDGEKIYP